MAYRNRIASHASKRPSGPLVSLDRFDRATIEEARKVFLGESAWYRFDENGTLLDLQPHRDPTDPPLTTEETARQWEQSLRKFRAWDHNKWKEHNEIERAGLTDAESQQAVAELEHGFRPYSNLRDGKRALAGAVLALIANYQAAHNLPEESVQLTVASMRHDAMASVFKARLGNAAYGLGVNLRHIEEPSESADPKILQHVRDKCAEEQDRHMAWLEEDLHRLASFDTPETQAELRRIYEEDGAIDGEDGCLDKRRLLRACMDAATNIHANAEGVAAYFREPPDHWQRSANQYPAAVSFIRKTSEYAFLLNFDGSTKKIDDLPSFLSNEWSTLMGHVELKVQPEILTALRAQLQGRGIASAIQD